jgi:predicted DNA-binding protein
MNKTLTFRIPEELRKGLREISRAEGKPVSYLVRETL